MTSPARPSLALQRASIALVHPRGSRGKVCTARATPGMGRGWDEGLVAPSSRAMSEQIASADVEYQGMLRFTGRRHSRNVTGIGSAFQDLDYYKDGLPHAGATAEDVAGILLAAYEAAGLPRPSYIQDSGRGAYGVFLFAGISGKALSRWQAAMRNLRGPKLDADGNVPARRGKVDPKVLAFEARMLPLWRILRDLGLDRGAFDPARVLRVMGAVNPKSGRLSVLAWPSSIQDIERVDFDAWCDALMPYTRAEMRALRAERAAWKAANPDHVPAVRNAPRRRQGGKWTMILADLERLLDHRGAAEFERLKLRDLWTLFAATAISVTEGGSAEAWAERLAPMIRLPVKEVEVSLSGVERGMIAHQAGETVDYKGAVRAAFYDYSYARIVDELDIGIEEACEAGLRVLVPGGAIPMSDAERQRASRDARNPERNKRADQAEERLARGLWAYAMRQAGGTDAQSAEDFGLSKGSMSKALTEAEAYVEAHGVPLLAQMFAMKPMMAGSEEHLRAIANEDESREETADVVHDVSRSIVVSDPIAAPAAFPAPVTASPIPAGDVRETRFTPFYAEYRTATEAWSITRVKEFGGWIEYRDALPLAEAASTIQPLRPASASDDGLLAVVMGMASAEAARDRRQARKAAQRRPVARAAAASRTIALAPLDVAHEARLYRQATQGF